MLGCTIAEAGGIASGMHKSLCQSSGEMQRNRGFIIAGATFSTLGVGVMFGGARRLARSDRTLTKWSPLLPLLTAAVGGTTVPLWGISGINDMCLNS